MPASRTKAFLKDFRSWAEALPEESFELTRTCLQRTNTGRSRCWLHYRRVRRLAESDGAQELIDESIAVGDL